MPEKIVRCAIYTRKSSEEGLDQSFNSLEAQREACEAFIHSQKHEGWQAIKSQYDDGGFSGGTMERPALAGLLEDVRSGKIDTIVVYKVDRLTRSLMDFAKIIETFDQYHVSFVSVTQQFNTTTSMGRLTLNVLLSFAQFEREITGERIRDKIAASKKKGMWMGGIIPLGYDRIGRRLVANRAEASKVREIFTAYLRLGCVSKLRRHLNETETRSKSRIDRDGRECGNASFSRGALYHLLRNRIYVGEIVHKHEHYQGQHEAVVPQDLWDQVQARLEFNNRAHRKGASSSTRSLLTGKLFDPAGVPFTPTHTVKNGKRYRYYTSQAVIQQSGSRPPIARFPAQDLEALVETQIRSLLADPNTCAAGLRNKRLKAAVIEGAGRLTQKWVKLEALKQEEFVRVVLKRVVLGEKTVSIEIDRKSLFKSLAPIHAKDFDALRSPFPELVINSNFEVRQRGSEIRVIAPGTVVPSNRRSQSLVRAIARARSWYEQIANGEVGTIDNLVRESHLAPAYVRRILPCATLAPRVVEAMLAGAQSPDVTLMDVSESIPFDWKEQEQKFLRPA